MAHATETCHRVRPGTTCAAATIASTATARIGKRPGRGSATTAAATERRAPSSDARAATAAEA